MPEEGSLLRIFVGESDNHEGMPLYEWIVRKARERGLAHDIDFQSRNVSIIKKLGLLMSRVKKILPALGLALLIACGTFAVSLAQEFPSRSSRKSLQLSGVLNNGPAQMDRHTLSVGMNFEAGGLTDFLSPKSKVLRVIYSHEIEPLRLSISKRPCAAKVSLQLRDLVLLI